MKRKTQNAKRKTSFTVAVVTGTRAEYGIWRPILNAIQQSNSLNLKLIVTGMHLLKNFGNTVKEIEATGKIAARAPMYRPNETPEKSLSRGITNLAAAYQKTKPDLVFLLGDRLEMLAAASAALAARIPIAHLHGGETAPGIWDEQIRHAITKLAHLHFCSTKTAAHRILQMGEDPRRVHVVGAPALDTVIALIRKTPLLLKLRRQHGVRPILLLHPSSPDDAQEYRRARMLLDIAIDRLDGSFRFLSIVGPNNDPGHKGILRAYRERADRIDLEMSLSQGDFFYELIASNVLIGNSSSGIIEAASFGIPVINIGDRQAGRERNPNVIDVPWQKSAIERALKEATTDKPFLRRVAQCKNLYGDGHASQRIVAILEKIARTGLALTKKFHDA